MPGHQGSVHTSTIPQNAFGPQPSIDVRRTNPRWIPWSMPSSRSSAARLCRAAGQHRAGSLLGHRGARGRRDKFANLLPFASALPGLRTQVDWHLAYLTEDTIPHRVKRATADDGPAQPAIGPLRGGTIRIARENRGATMALNGEYNPSWCANLPSDPATRITPWGCRGRFRYTCSNRSRQGSARMGSFRRTRTAGVIR